MVKATIIADVWRPNEKIRAVLYDVILIFGFSLLIAISAQIAVGWPVPVTGQTFAVLMAGMLLGANRGCLCIIAYLLEGAAGLPVFSHGRAGLAVFLGPTGGYLIGFVAAAYVTGLLSQNGWGCKVLTAAASMLIGNIILYVFGICWLFILTKNSNILAVGLYPFIVGDILKIALAASLLPAAWKIIRHFEN